LEDTGVRLDRPRPLLNGHRQNEKRRKRNLPHRVRDYNALIGTFLYFVTAYDLQPMQLVFLPRG
jgi:hypothetical protein